MIPMDSVIDVYAYTASDDPEHEDELLCSCTFAEFAEANEDGIEPAELDDIRARMVTNPAHIIGGGASPALLLVLAD